MIWNRDTFRVKLAGITFKCRKMNEFDLLGITGCIPIFQLKKASFKVNPVQAMIDDHDADTDAQDEDKSKQMVFMRHIVDRCLIGAKTRRKGIKQSTLQRIINSEQVTQALYRHIAARSVDLTLITEIDRSQAESIYNIYQGQNYAHAYFGKGKLGKIEEYAFNLVIHNAGVSQRPRGN